MADGLIARPFSGTIEERTLPKLFFALSLLVCLGSVALVGSAFLYQTIISRSTETTKTDVTNIEQDLQTANLAQLLALDQGLRSLRSLLENHVAPTNTLDLLQNNTISGIRFTTFSYSSEAKRVDLAGESSSYALLAEQVRVFESISSEVERVDFGGLSLGTHNVITFKMSLVLKPSHFLYRTP